MATNFTVTNTTAADGSGMIGWVPSQSRRSSLDIILSCLSIFLVCSWKCVHLNMPSYEETHSGWYTIGELRGRPRTTKEGSESWTMLSMIRHIWNQAPVIPRRPLLRKWGRQLSWMCFVSIAPELGVAVAVKQWELARRDANTVSRLFEHRYGTKDVEGAMTRSFFARMGGIVIRVVAARQDDAPRVARCCARDDGVVLASDRPLSGLEATPRGVNSPEYEVVGDIVPLTCKKSPFQPQRVMCVECRGCNFWNR